jgi:hypothetical protein
MDQDELLYHYTSIAGLHGIVSSRTVWASDCRYLNDQKELVHAVEALLKRCEPSTKTMLTTAFHWYSYSQAHCVFALSRSPRVLSQWRSYGDDGRGAAIGFNRKYLLSAGKSFTRLLVDCVYEDHEIFLDEVYEKSRAEFEAVRKMHTDAGGACNTFWDQIRENPLPLAKLYAELLRVKNEAFKEEQEARLVVSTPLASVKTRVVKGLIVPYIEHDLIDKGEAEYLWCIAPEIWLGPKCDKRNERAIHFFEQFGWGINGIKHYDCGYV